MGRRKQTQEPLHRVLAEDEAPADVAAEPTNILPEPTPEPPPAQVTLRWTGPGFLTWGTEAATRQFYPRRPVQVDEPLAQAILATEWARHFVKE